MEWTDILLALGVIVCGLYMLVLYGTDRRYDDYYEQEWIDG